MIRKTYTIETALPKIRQFCSYQERSHKETRDKLYGFGLYKKEVEHILSVLIEENYLNEERFATAFARGRFRIKQWGKVKIGHELKLRQVSAYNLRKALEAIDEADYQATLSKLVRKKWDQLSGKGAQEAIIRNKIRLWLMSRGYEPTRIHAALSGLNNSHGNSMAPMN